MKIVDRKTFLALPSGTIYAKYDFQSFGELMAKGTTIGGINENLAGDFSNLSLTNEVKTHLGPGRFDTLDHSEEHGSSFGLDFECYGRDGLYDHEQMFAIWERPDIEGLMGKLQEGLDVLPDPMKIPLVLFSPMKNPFATYLEFRDIWPDRNNAPEKDFLNWLEDPGTERKYLIVVEGRVVGLTGLWEMDVKKLALAWHGIIPSERKKGYSEAALIRLIEQCRKDYPNAKELVESIPQDREDELRGFFQKLGFVRTGEIVNHPEMMEGVVWMEYVLEL